MGQPSCPGAECKRDMLGCTAKKIHQGALGSAESKEPEGTVFMQLLSSTHLSLGCFIHKREPVNQCGGPGVLSPAICWPRAAWGSKELQNLLQHPQTPRMDLATLPAELELPPELISFNRGKASQIPPQAQDGRWRH